MIYDIEPTPKPRMVSSDRWKMRPEVMRYWAFKDHVRGLKIAVPESCAHVIFHIAMPKSWSKAKKDRMDGKPHQQKPDVDNYTKALMDAVFDNDAHIWDMRVTKRWAKKAAIEICD